MFEEFFTVTHPDGFTGDCGLMVSLWEDSDCSTRRMDQADGNIDGSRVQPYLAAPDSEGNRKIRVMSDSYMANTTYYLRGETHGLQKLCIPLTFKVQCGVLAFPDRLKQPVQLEYNQKTKTKTVDLSKDDFKVANINEGCPVDADEGYKL